MFTLLHTSPILRFQKDLISPGHAWAASALGKQIEEMLEIQDTRYPVDIVPHQKKPCTGHSFSLSHSTSSPFRTEICDPIHAKPPWLTLGEISSKNLLPLWCNESFHSMHDLNTGVGFSFVLILHSYNIVCQPLHVFPIGFRPCLQIGTTQRTLNKIWDLQTLAQSSPESWLTFLRHHWTWIPRETASSSPISIF